MVHMLGIFRKILIQNEVEMHSLLSQYILIMKMVIMNTNSSQNILWFNS